eukprot:403375029
MSIQQPESPAIIQTKAQEPISFPVPQQHQLADLPLQSQFLVKPQKSLQIHRSQSHASNLTRNSSSQHQASQSHTLLPNQQQQQQPSSQMLSSRAESDYNYMQNLELQIEEMFNDPQVKNLTQKITKIQRNNKQFKTLWFQKITPFNKVIIPRKAMERLQFEEIKKKEQAENQLMMSPIKNKKKFNIAKKQTTITVNIQQEQTQNVDNSKEQVETQSNNGLNLKAILKPTLSQSDLTIQISLRETLTPIDQLFKKMGSESERLNEYQVEEFSIGQQRKNKNEMDRINTQRADKLMHLIQQNPIVTDRQRRENILENYRKTALQLPRPQSQQNYKKNDNQTTGDPFFITQTQQAITQRGDIQETHAQKKIQYSNGFQRKKMSFQDIISPKIKLGNYDITQHQQKRELMKNMFNFHKKSQSSQKSRLQDQNLQQQNYDQVRAFTATTSVQQLNRRKSIIRGRNQGGLYGNLSGNEQNLYFNENSNQIEDITRRDSNQSAQLQIPINFHGGAKSRNSLIYNANNIDFKSQGPQVLKDALNQLQHHFIEPGDQMKKRLAQHLLIKSKFTMSDIEISKTAKLKNLLQGIEKNQEYYQKTQRNMNYLENEFQKDLENAHKTLNQKQKYNESILENNILQRNARFSQSFKKQQAINSYRDTRFDKTNEILQNQSQIEFYKETQKQTVNIVI